MNFDAYRNIPAINWSTLKKGAQSMRHLRHALDTEDSDTASRVVLRLNHAAVLEPHTVDRDYLVYDGVRRGKEYEAFKALHPGAQYVKAEDITEARRIADAVMSYRPARDLIEGAQCEQNLVWTDPETRVDCKGRMDVYRAGHHIADLKGAKTTDSFGFVRHVSDYLYYGQAAWYQMGAEVLHGTRLPYSLIVYEQEAPHDVAVFRVDDDWLQPGRDLARRLLREYAACMESGVWPGRYADVQSLPSPPKYINPDVGDDFEIVE